MTILRYEVAHKGLHSRLRLSKNSKPGGVMILRPLKLIILSLFLIGGSAYSATVMTDVDGHSVTATSPEGQGIVINEGDEVTDGTVVNVASGQSVTMATDTGMEVLVGQNSQVKIGSDDEPIFELLKGEIRSFISDDKDKEKRPRLRIQTRDAIVGVRGTDFVVSSIGLGTDLKALDGQVVVAKSKEAMSRGETTAVGPGESINGMRPGRIFQKEKFNRDEFLKSFASRHPRLAALKERAGRRRLVFHDVIAKKRAARRQRREEIREEIREERRERRRSRQGK